MKLTYGGKTFIYGFTVASSPIVPVTAVVPAASVDVTKSGFKLRVHQTEQTQGTATADRAERQLAGLLAPNVADLTAANPDGTFDVELINLDQDGADAGDFGGDSLIPGIPGSVGNTENIAMEVVGYLDLKAGAYSIGTVSDDSLRLSIGADPRDVTSLRLIDIPSGRSVASFIIQQAGIYPIRALWTEATGHQPRALEPGRGRDEDTPERPRHGRAH